MTYEDCDDVLVGFNLTDEETADYLPAKPRGDSDDEDSDNDDNNDDEDDEPDTTLTVPPGFKPLAKPETLPTCIDGLFAMMVLFDDMVWQFHAGHRAPPEPSALQLQVLLSRRGPPEHLRQARQVLRPRLGGGRARLMDLRNEDCP